MWANGLYSMLDSIVSTDVPSSIIVDTREDSARMGQVCAAAVLMNEVGHLDATRLSKYKSYCADEVNLHFAPRVGPHGEFTGPQFGLTTNNQGLSTVTVTRGSPYVTSQNNDFPCGQITMGTGSGASRIWFVQDKSLQSLASGGDPMSYAVDSCTPSTIVLHVPYNGLWQGSGRGYALNQIGGAFTQPFLMGYMAGEFAIAGEALMELGDPATAKTAQTLAAGLAAYIVNPTYGGYRPATGGLFYVRGGLMNDGTVGGPTGSGGCEPDPEVANNNGGICTGAPNDSDTIQESRFLGADTVRGLSHGYLANPNTTLKSSIDQFFGKMWGGLGGPGADGNYLSEFFPSAESGKAKDFGFCCGMGGGAQWAAARVAGVYSSRLNAVKTATISVGYDLRSVPGAVRARLTAIEPTGVSRAVECTDSPCTMTADAEMGEHVVGVEYLDATGNPITRTAPRLMKPIE
jgi:hypothetical protein